MAEPATLMERNLAALASGDFEALAATYHEDVVEDFLVIGPIEGKATVRAFFETMFVAFPDLVFTIERIMGVDDRTAVGQWMIEGTFSGGPFLDLAPTGKRVSIRGVDVMEFEDDLLVRNTIYYDGLRFARQIGLLPPEGSRRDQAIMGGFNLLTKTKSKIGRSKS